MTLETLSRSSSLASNDFLGAFSEDAVPSRPSTTPQSEIQIPVEGVDQPLKLAVDAGPGCGGIAWPAGEVSDCDLEPETRGINKYKRKTLLPRRC